MLRWSGDDVTSRVRGFQPLVSTNGAAAIRQLLASHGSIRVSWKLPTVCECGRSSCKYQGAVGLPNLARFVSGQLSLCTPIATTCIEDGVC